MRPVQPVVELAQLGDQRLRASGPELLEDLVVELGAQRSVVEVRRPAGFGRPEQPARAVGDGVPLDEAVLDRGVDLAVDRRLVELELVGYFNATNDQPYPPYSGYGTVLVPVECLPYKGASGDVAVSGGDNGNAPLIIKDAKLFLTTYAGQNDGVTMKGCKALKTTVRFETNKTGPVSFDLNRFPGGATSHTVEAEYDAGDGKFYAR